MNTTSYKKHALLFTAGLFGLVASAQASLVITDTFENRTTGSSLNQSAVSGPNDPATAWYWQGIANTLQIAEAGGNKFVAFNKVSYVSLSLSSTPFSGGRIKLSSDTHYRLNYDLLWMQNYGGNTGTGFTVFLNTNNTFANFSTAGTPGYLFRTVVTAANTVGWEILQNQNQVIASGSAMIAGVLPSIDNTPGAPVSVQIDWLGNTMSLGLNGTTVWNSAQTPFTPAAQNANLPTDTYLMFQVAANRAQGIDNFSLIEVSQVPEPASAALLLGGGAVLLAATRRFGRAE